MGIPQDEISIQDKHSNRLSFNLELADHNTP